MRTVTVSTELPASATTVWGAVQTPDAFRFVAAPMLRYPAAAAIDRPWRVGDVVVGWTFLIGIVPFSRHRLEVIVIDAERRHIATREGGGPIRTWDHVIDVEWLGTRTCRYRDRIDIDAGRLTWLVAAYAEVFYRHRQRRWRRLARLLEHTALAGSRRASLGGGAGRR